MDAAMIVAAAGLIVALASIGIGLVTLSRLRKRSAGDHADLGGAKTPRSYSYSGSMSWESLFDPEDHVNDEARARATYVIIGFYAVAGAVTVAMAYAGLTWGYYLGLLAVGYATFIIGVNYAKARRRKIG